MNFKNNKKINYSEIEEVLQDYGLITAQQRQAKAQERKEKAK